MPRRVWMAWALCAAVAAGAAAGEPLGLVLSGGGAKGAYEVGVWNALVETGRAADVRAISGTSVGALNAALFAARPDAAAALWLENMDGVFALDAKAIGRSVQTTLDDASKSMEVAEKTGEAWKGWVSFGLRTAFRILSDADDITLSPAECEGCVDSAKLAGALDASLPRIWPDGAPDVYATATEKNTWSPKTWHLNGESHERRVRMILASTAIPLAFDTQVVDGKVYADGGWEARGGDNAPLAPLLERHPEIRTVWVVYLADEAHVDPKRRRENRAVADARGIRLVEIIPEGDIDGGWFGWQGVFDASPKAARRLMEMGRRDALRILSPPRR